MTPDLSLDGKVARLLSPTALAPKTFRYSLSEFAND